MARPRRISTGFLAPTRFWGYRTSITRLTLLRHASTAATRRPAFDGDDPLDPAGAAAARAMASHLGRFGPDAVWCGPEASTRETAAAIGLPVAVALALAGADPGAWRGRTVEEISRSDPARLAAWMTDPAVPAPGGESVLDVMTRVAAWLDERTGEGRSVLAMTHAVVIAAAVAHALGAPPAAVWRIDVAPLSRTVLHTRRGGWAVRAVNVGPVLSRRDR